MVPASCTNHNNMNLQQVVCIFDTNHRSCFDLLRLLRKPRRFPGLLDLRATMSKYFEAGKPRWPGNVEVIAIGFPDVWKKDKILEVLVNLLVCVGDASSGDCYLVVASFYDDRRFWLVTTSHGKLFP